MEDNGGGLMKHIGIVTLFHNSLNYGGVLQAFALLHTLEKENNTVFELDYKSEKRTSSKNAFFLILKRDGFVPAISKISRSICKKLYSKANAKKYYSSFKKRAEAFQQFKQNHFHNVIECTRENIYEVTSGMDAFVCGSDQIWKPSVVDDIYMLNFTGEEKVRKFSYAASLSVDSLQEGDKERYSNWLSKLNGISVREKKAVELLQPLTEKEVIQVCDPVFLIDKQEWLALSGSNRKIEENYLFCYFLGDDKNYRLYAKQFAESRGYKIVTFPNLLQVPRKVDSSFGDYKIYDASPLDFVNIIAKASFVITDSFHATTFSIINNTPFAVFERNAVLSMNSRISGLLEPLCLEERFVSNYKQLAGLSDTFKWDFVNTKIKGEQQRALCYLHEQLI